MLSFIKLTLLGGWRVRSSRTVLALALASVLAAWLAGTFSPRQPQTVAFDVGFSLIRILGALITLFWVQELVSKDLERKTVIWACANPISRGHYVLGRYLGIAGMALLAIGLMGGLLTLSLGVVAPQVQQALPLILGWHMALLFAFLWFDLLVIAAFGLLMALVSTTSLLPFFVGTAFAIVARGLGPTLAYAKAGDSNAAEWAPTLDAIQWLLPDLSRYDIRGVVLYGQWPPADLMYFVPLQALAYVAMLLAVAILAFVRREFE